MKMFLIVVLICCDVCYSQKTEGDPSGVGVIPVSAKQNNESMREAGNIITRELLVGFEEAELGMGEPKKGRPFNRIFTDTSGKHPTLLKWFMPIVGNQQAILEMKQITKKNGKWTISQRQITKISSEQQKLLERMLEESKPLTLPNSDWMPDGVVDGTTWIYEFQQPEGSYILIRCCPVDVWGKDVYDTADVSIERFARESRLTTLALLLWMISGSKGAVP